jgi:galactose oxidase
VHRGDTFEIGTPQAGNINTVSLVRLSSVTHAFNANQRINLLPPQLEGGSLKVTVPLNPNVCLPGHYMLFILDQQGVPSMAKIMQITAPIGAAAQIRRGAQPEALAASTPTSAREAPKDAFALSTMVRDAARGTQVVVGITGTCPYGISACWGGANEALRNLEGVRYVDPIPDGYRSTATVYLEDDRLPALNRWDEQFRQMVHDTYLMRGVEVSLKGTLEAWDDVLVMVADGRRPSVELVPLGPGEKIQWDRAAARPEPVSPNEGAAYNILTRSSQAAGAQQLTVTGPLLQTEAGYRLKVRQVQS